MPVYPGALRLARDPGSMAKVIRWTTSPAYRLLGPVSSDSDRRGCPTFSWKL